MAKGSVASKGSGSFWTKGLSASSLGMTSKEFAKLTEEQKKRLAQEKAASGAGAALGDLSEALADPAEGQMAQTPGTVTKGNLSHADPSFRSAVQTGLRGRSFKKGGSVKPRDGVAIKGKTRGRLV